MNSDSDITVQYDKDGNLVTLGGLRQLVRQEARQEVIRSLYAILHSEPEANIDVMSAAEFEAFCQRVLSEEEHV